MYIQAFVMRSTPPIIISVTHSYVGKPCPVTDIVDPGYPDDVFNISLADGTGVGVGVGPGVGVGVGPGVGVGVGSGVAVGGMVTVKDVLAYDDLDLTDSSFRPYPTPECGIDTFTLNVPSYQIDGQFDGITEIPPNLISSRHLLKGNPLPLIAIIVPGGPL